MEGLANYIGLIGVAAFIIAIIMLMNLVQRAFEQAGILWGLLTIIYPPGTYKFCKTNWEKYGNKFLIITALLVFSVIIYFVNRL